MGVAARSEEDNDDVRCGSRDATRVRVRALIDARKEGVELPLFVHDLSLTGMKVETRFASLAVGEYFKVRLPLLLEQLVEVMWVHDRVAGVAFAEPLSPATLPIVLRAMAPAQDNDRD